MSNGKLSYYIVNLTVSRINIFKVLQNIHKILKILYPQGKVTL